MAMTKINLAVGREAGEAPIDIRHVAVWLLTRKIARLVQ